MRDGPKIQSKVCYGKCISQSHGHFIEVRIEYKKDNE